MTKFIGIKNNRISIISDNKFSSDAEIIELPKELENIPITDLITKYHIKNGKLTSKINNKPVNEIKLALVGNWKQQCGISTYAENLWPEIVKYIGDFKLFIENNSYNTGPLNQFGNEIISNDKIIQCWKRGNSLKELIDAIKIYNPDVIIFQHEFGLWPNAAYWISMMSQLYDYRIITTMHSTFHHRDKTIVEACIPEIVVHLEEARNVLKNEKQIPGKVYVIPHGCSNYDPEKLWNFYKSEKTFIQLGFGFRYKNFESSIKAVSLLKYKYSDIFFTALFSESDHNKIEHQIYYNELIDLAEKLNVKENIAIIRGYKSDATIDSYLKTNKVAVFPYKEIIGHSCYGASGAARVCFSKGIPCITSSIPHFSDLPSIKANTPEEIALALDKLFLSEQNRKEQVEKQAEHIKHNTWEKMAKEYIKLLNNNQLD